MTTITQTQAAEISGLSSRRLRQLDDTGGGPPRNSQGLYDAKKFGLWNRKRIASDLGIAADGKRYDLAAERARHSKELADAKHLENSEARGDLVSLSVVSSELKNAALLIRTNALALPTKVAPMLEGLSAPEIKAILDREMRALLVALASLDISARAPADTSEAA